MPTENWMSKNYSRASSGAVGGSQASVQGTIRLTLLDQSNVSDVTFPTHFTVPASRGTLTGQTLYLQETLPNGTISTIPAQYETAGSWDDGSIKWLHVYANVKWVGGVKASYVLQWGQNITSGGEGSLVTSDVGSGILVNTGTTTFTILKNQPGIVCAGVVNSGQFLEIGDSGGSSFYASSGAAPTMTVELSGSNIFTVRMEGAYGGAGSFAKYVTRITARSNSSIVEFDHATVFTGDMRTKYVDHIVYYFPNFSGEIFGKHVAEKAPCAISSGNVLGGGQFAQWPAHADSQTSADWNIQNGWELRWLKNAKYLNAVVPTGYKALFTSPAMVTETIELSTQSGTLNNADMRGVSMHNEFAINLGAATGSGYHNLWRAKPIGFISPTDAAATFVMGPVAAIGDGVYSYADDYAIQVIKGHYKAIGRYGDSGWFSFGNTHHSEWPASNRPTYHRIWNNNHYGQVTAAWNTFFASADSGVLDCARSAVDYLSSIGQCKYTVPSAEDVGKCRKKGAFYHCKTFLPWGFRGSGDNVGDYAYGTELDCAFTSHFSHADGLLMAWYMDANRWCKEGYEDWLYGIGASGNTDGANGGYGQRWMTFYDRDTNTSLFQALKAYEYAPNTSGLLAGISGGISGIMAYSSGGQPYPVNANLTQTQSGPIWEPMYMSKYHELFPNDTVFNAYLLTSANNFNRAICLANKTGGEWGTAIAATAYDMTGDATYLTMYSGALDRITRRIYAGPSSQWENFGAEYVSDDEGEWTYQWPRLKYALKKIDTVTRFREVGTYPMINITSYSLSGSVKSVGSRFYILAGTTQPTIDVQVTTLKAGDVGVASIWWTQTSGTISLITDHLAVASGSGVAGGPPITYVRPSTHVVIREQYTIPATGLVKVLIGANSLAMYRNLTDYPEMMALQNYYSTWGTVAYTAKDVDGYIYLTTPSAVTGVITSALSYNIATTQTPYFCGINGSGSWLLPGESATYVLQPGVYYPVSGNGSKAGHGQWTFRIDNAVSGQGLGNDQNSNNGVVGFFGTLENLQTLIPLYQARIGF